MNKHFRGVEDVGVAGRLAVSQRREDCMDLDGRLCRKGWQTQRSHSDDAQKWQ